MKQTNPGMLLLFLSLFLAPNIAAQTDVQFRLRVTADAELTRELVHCLEERLAALPGVRITDDAEMRLRLIALEQKSTDGGTFGYLFYQAGLMPSHDPNAFYVLWETLRSLPPDLPAACDRLAEGFHQQVITPTQQGVGGFRQQLHDKAPTQ
ncbi:MAG: hypothetical protein AAF657_22590 [Acidobacteriota bacterium]